MQKCAHVNSKNILDITYRMVYNTAMYIDVIPNRNSPPAVLLRESHREGNKTVKTTIANLSACPPDAVAAFCLALRGKKLVSADSHFATERSTPHGHVEAVLGMFRKLGMESLLASRPCRDRDLSLAMIAQRILHPCSKLATTRIWHSTTLAQELGVENANANALYKAMEWLGKRQSRIEKKLAKRHLEGDAKVLYDISSSSYHGRKCNLAVFGYNRDGEKLPSIVYGLLTDVSVCPISVDVYPGNTKDCTTVSGQVEKLRGNFGLERVVLVGDRGMLTQTQIDEFKQYPGLGWISALTFTSIRELAEAGDFQPSLFDKQDLAEITSESFPGERLIVCYNPLLDGDRSRTRDELLDATETRLARIVAEVKRRTKKPLNAADIGLKVGRIINRHKMGKHFILTIEDNHLSFKRNEESIKQEDALDGFYIIRTSENKADLSPENVVRTYKSLGQVEQAFRCIKSLDLQVRPIRHRSESHVRAHIFLCTLAYYVQWHLRKALSPLLFQDDELDENRWNRDPVAKAKSSATACRKKSYKKTHDGWPVHSLDTLLANLATRSKNTCRAGEGKTAIRFEQITEPTDFQRHVFSLLGLKL